MTLVQGNFFPVFSFFRLIYFMVLFFGTVFPSFFPLVVFFKIIFWRDSSPNLHDVSSKQLFFQFSVFSAFNLFYGTFFGTIFPSFFPLVIFFKIFSWRSPNLFSLLKFKIPFFSVFSFPRLIYFLVPFYGTIFSFFPSSGPFFFQDIYLKRFKLV